MKILDNNQNSDSWLESRLGKLTGSKLHSIVVKRGTKKKIGFYEILAERLAMQDQKEYDNPMERGHELEEVAIKEFENITGKSVESVGLCISDFNDAIAFSPDGLIKNAEKYNEAVEVKCLSSAKHLQSYFEHEIPKEYYEQAIQYFIVNEELETLYFVLYDPRVTCLPLHYIELKRSELADDIEFLKQYQIETLAEIDKLILDLTF